MAAVTEPFPEDSCPICLTELGKVGITVTKCGHTFHSECLDKCTKDACPKCRQPFKSKKVEVPNREYQILEFKYADHNLRRSKRFQHLYRNGEETVLINGCNLLISSFEQTLYWFERTGDWACLAPEVILLLFQNSKNHEMYRTINLEVNYDFRYRSFTFYKNSVRDALIYCYQHYGALNNLSELLECIMRYEESYLILECFNAPKIHNLIKKPIANHTLIRFLKLPTIQKQLKDPIMVKECRQILAGTRTLEIFNKYVPSSCVIM